jgi:hypothetical protein
MGESGFRSIDELRRYNRALAQKRVEDDPVTRAWYTAKRVTWMLVLAASFLIYYLLLKMLEALSLL